MIPRSTIIKRRVLKMLADTPQGYMQPEEAIITEIQLLITPPPYESEIGQVIRDLDALRLITSVVSTFDGLRRWKITDAGRAELGLI